MLPCSDRRKGTSEAVEVCFLSSMNRKKRLRMRGISAVWTGLLFWTGFLVSSSAQGQDSQPAYLTPETAGPDFSIQGEYLGLIGDVYPLGAQIIGRGSGTFEGILFGGGLPGAGWDEKTRFHLRGQQTSGFGRSTWGTTHVYQSQYQGNH